MGTSKSYKPPVVPPWPDLKKQVTRTSKESNRDADVIKDIVREYIKTSGGSRSVSGGRGSVGGSSASRVAKNIGSVFGLISQDGLKDALKDLGLQSLVGKSVNDIVFALMDKIGEAAATIDDVDARNALSTLMDELFSEVKTSEELESKINEIVDEDRLNEIMQDFFGHYLYEQFCRVFYEHLVTRVGQEKADSYLKDIKDYIKSKLRSHTSNVSATNINWKGTEGKRIAQKIMHDTLEVFGG